MAGPRQIVNTGNWKWACSGGALLALLAACAALEPQPRAPDVNLGGFSHSFKQGYADGCGSAGARRPRRDEARYRSEGDYRTGWNDGYAICARRK